MNRAESLKIALRSFAFQDYPPDSYEIIVVDNGSTDDTAAVADSAISRYAGRRIRYIAEPIPGLLSGRHRGAMEAQGDLLCFVDDDIEAVPTWISAVVGAFANKSVHLVGGPSVPRFEADPPNWMDRFMDCRDGRVRCGDLSLFDIGDRTVRIDPTYVWGLNYSIRKKTLFDLGGFHPDCIPKKLQHFQGDGETGLALKIRKKGLAAVYAGGARVIHYIPRERFTVTYFEDRYFYQGVCDSYTRIREARGVSNVIDGQPAGTLSSVSAPTNGSIYDQYRHIVYERIQAAHTAGFLFHHEAVRADPRLLNWVLQDDYIDYRLPDLTVATGSQSGGKGQKAGDMLAADLAIEGQLEAFWQSPLKQQ